LERPTPLKGGEKTEQKGEVRFEKGTSSHDKEEKKRSSRRGKVALMNIREKKKGGLLAVGKKATGF